MKKYWIVFVNSVQKALVYRFRIVTWAVTNSILPLIMMALWTKYYQAGNVINGYSYHQLAAYYLCVLIVSSWTSKIHDKVKDDIKDGELANYIIKPFGYFRFRFSGEFGWYVISSLFLLLPTIFVLLIYVNFSLISLLVLFVMLLPTYLLSFYLSMFVGLLSFYITETTGITNLHAMFTELLTGKFFPLTLFPPIAIKILDYLPFKYMYYFPIQLSLGTLGFSQIIKGVIILGTWIMILCLACSWLWHKGIKKFSSVGL